MPDFAAGQGSVLLRRKYCISWRLCRIDAILTILTIARAQCCRCIDAERKARVPGAVSFSHSWLYGCTGRQKMPSFE
jgi:hypothetical protein